MSTRNISNADVAALLCLVITRRLIDWNLAANFVKVRAFSAGQVHLGDKGFFGGGDKEQIRGNCLRYYTRCE